MLRDVGMFLTSAEYIKGFNLVNGGQGGHFPFVAGVVGADPQVELATVDRHPTVGMILPITELVGIKVLK